MTEIYDSNGYRITVGARVEEPDTDGIPYGVGTVIQLTEPDGDVNEYGRQVAVGPFVVVEYDDGTTERWTASWNATGPWDDHRTDYTCDDVTVTVKRETCRKCGTTLNADGLCADETCPYSDAPQSTEWDDDGYQREPDGQRIEAGRIVPTSR